LGKGEVLCSASPFYLSKMLRNIFTSQRLANKMEPRIAQMLRDWFLPNEKSAWRTRQIAQQSK